MGQKAWHELEQGKRRRAMEGWRGGQGSGAVLRSTK